MNPGNDRCPFNPAEFYHAAASGERVDPTMVLQFIRQFRHVVLWGASYLGLAVGAYLQGQDIPVTRYWDLRAAELGPVNGVEVGQPFSGGLEPGSTLVILCIGNVVITPPLLGQLNERGYAHLKGDYLFMGALCPFHTRSGVSPEVCIRSMACRYIYCPRLGSIARNQVLAGGPPPADDLLYFDNITLVINSVCTLSCKNCTSYMPSYPAGRKRNYPLSRVLADLDRVFEAVDGIGSVSIMGGEPFLHPDLARITLAVMGKKNFTGLISIATSGTAPIREEHLAGLDNPRLNISFGNYLSSIGENAQRIWHANVRLVKQRGIPYTVGVDQPQWIVPSTLYDRGPSAESMTARKSGCPTPPRMLHIKDGKIHPCDLANSVYTLGIADYPSDYVDLDGDKASLRQRIREFLAAPYYRICGHCAPTGAVAPHGAEQGYQDFLTRPAAEA